MNLELNSEEILEIACQIEREGAAFYRRAIDAVNDETVKKLLRELASLEEEHEISFESLRADPDILAAFLGDPESENCQYLRALARGHLFSGAENPADILRGDVDVVTVLKTAIGLEVASIAFYQGIRELLSDELNKSKLSAIIKEERRHVIILNEALSKY